MSKYTEQERVSLQTACIAMRESGFTFRQISRMLNVSITFAQDSCIELSQEQKKQERDAFAREAKARELKAKKQERENATLLAAARPDGSRCTAKACPYPALVNGLCRGHFLDSRSESSLHGSPLAIAI